MNRGSSAGEKRENVSTVELRNKTPKRRVKAKLREGRCNATQPNETWAMDFVHDQLATGRKLRVLTAGLTRDRSAVSCSGRDANLHGATGHEPADSHSELASDKSL